MATHTHAPSSIEVPPAAASNLMQRLTTAAVGLPIVMMLGVIGGWGFAVLVTALVVIALLEFYAMAHDRPTQGCAWVGVPAGAAIVLAFHLGSPPLLIAALIGAAVGACLIIGGRHPRAWRQTIAQMSMTLVGLIYIAIPGGMLLAVRALPAGLVWLLLVFALTWGTDTFSYIGGRIFGRTKLAPTLSPKKTFEGALTGVIGGILPAFTLLLLTGHLSLGLIILIGFAPLVAIVGDLVESGIKRGFDVKDSHLPGFDLFPGHGGVLDRIDALILVTAYVYFGLIVAGLAG